MVSLQVVNRELKTDKTSDTNFSRFVGEKGILFHLPQIIKEMQIIGIISKCKKFRPILLYITVG